MFNKFKGNLNPKQKLNNELLPEIYHVFVIRIKWIKRNCALNGITMNMRLAQIIKRTIPRILVYNSKSQFLGFYHDCRNHGKAFRKAGDTRMKIVHN